ncbi:AAA family ATPase [Candidatus Methylocalor cossyra]|uniref:Exonuclease SbcC n=1 Tax=Candidatus Methylocalor cossyra TaxID=3108543 RepID=A0ABM9NKN7_9GAMM
MRILALRGRNLASLAEPFELDFRREPLASASLFAISGPTGAGKSTLLDALCLALYDAVPRLAKAGGNVRLPDVDDRTLTVSDPRQLLRRGAVEAYAEVDFQGGDGLAYRARWSVRRARGQRRGELQPAEMSLTRLSDGVPIGHGKREVQRAIQARLGLTFSQFTRAVLLAQNEFSVFLKADDNERAELLETLTGTDTFTALSRRTFDRAKAEQQALQILEAQLDDHRPLEATARDELERDRAAAAEAVAALEREREILDAHWRWYGHWEEARQDEQAALEAWQAAAAAQAKAAPRRHYWERVEAVQDARPLWHEFERTRQALDQAQAAEVAARAALGEAEAAWQGALAAVEEAKAARLRVEADWRAAQPLIEQAKRLDAELAALAQRHGEAGEARDQARQAAQAARQRLAAKAAEREVCAGELRATAAWLEAHRTARPLAENWEGWELRLTDANQLAREWAGHQRDLAAAAATVAQLQAQRERASADRAAAETALAKAEAALQEADRAYGEFDGAALAAARQRAESRRAHLAAAEQLGREAGRLRQHAAQLEAEIAALTRRCADTDQALTEVQGLQAQAETALAEAEQALRAAELACAENARELRQLLTPHTPCPVCGAREHPFAGHDPIPSATLAALRDRAEQCRREAQDQARREAALRATRERDGQRLEELRWEVQGVTETLARVQLDLDSNPLAAEFAVVAPEARPDWFTAGLSEVRAQLDHLAEREAAGRRAALARDAAQRARDEARERLHAAERGETLAQAALDKAHQAQAAAQQARDRTGARLEQRLRELDAAGLAPDWRTLWRDDPEGFLRARRQEAQDYRAQGEALAAAERRLGVLEAELTALAEAVELATAREQQAEEAYRRVDGEWAERRHQRHQLGDGRPASDLEAAWQQALEVAVAAVQDRERAAAEAGRRVSAAAAHHQAAEGSLTLAVAAAEHARTALDLRLAAQQRRFPADPPLDPDTLKAWLAHDAAWLAQERAALQALDSALREAEAVLGERRGRRETLERARPGDAPLDLVRERRAQLLTDLEAAKGRLGELDARLRSDDQRRQRTLELQAAARRQADKVRLWNQLNELIGSREGHKFRNYAQRLTLDVLLGYANRHLADLAPRYRLERVPDTLALTVVDQDMGDEIRSVHSLSGGESFLASLALALGLASLSANRVRVESLFIDEGFGSLDSETLGVAMQALDGLHAQGRKVGVISHVQEMTDRIGVRIQVQPLSGGRSRVEVIG